MKNMIKKAVVGVATLTASIMLVGCGQQSATSSESSHSSSSVARSSESKSAKAYRAANRLIRKHDYQGAYERLNSVNNRSKQAENLNNDLQNYLAAQDSYNNGDYDKAASNLKNLKSTSPAMRNAYVALQNQITSAKKGNSSSSSAVVASSSDTSSSASSAASRKAANNSSTTATTNSSNSSSTTANQAAANQTSSDVVVSFANKMGFSGKGYEIIPTAKNNNVYRFEVRRNNADNTVANMVGIYQYNSQTGAVTKLN